MTDEELETIETALDAAAETLRRHELATYAGMVEDSHAALVAEVERLRSENATARSMILAGIGDGLDVRQRIADLERENAALREHWQEVSSLAAALCGTAIERRDEEIASLKAQNAALREIAQAVATGDAILSREDHAEAQEWFDCLWCEQSAHKSEDVQHAPDCPVTRARALLQSDRES